MHLSTFLITDQSISYSSHSASSQSNFCWDKYLGVKLCLSKSTTRSFLAPKTSIWNLKTGVFFFFLGLYKVNKLFASLVVRVSSIFHMQLQCWITDADLREESLSELVYACLPLQLFVCISNRLAVASMSEEPLAPESSSFPPGQTV